MADDGMTIARWQELERAYLMSAAAVSNYVAATIEYDLPIDDATLRSLVATAETARLAWKQADIALVKSPEIMLRRTERYLADAHTRRAARD